MKIPTDICTYPPFSCCVSVSSAMLRNSWNSSAQSHKHTITQFTDTLDNNKRLYRITPMTPVAHHIHSTSLNKPIGKRERCGDGGRRRRPMCVCVYIRTFPATSVRAMSLNRSARIYLYKRWRWRRWWSGRACDDERPQRQRRASLAISSAESAWLARWWLARCARRSRLFGCMCVCVCILCSCAFADAARLSLGFARVRATHTRRWNAKADTHTHMSSTQTGRRKCASVCARVVDSNTRVLCDVGMSPTEGCAWYSFVVEFERARSLRRCACETFINDTRRRRRRRHIFV